MFGLRKWIMELVERLFVRAGEVGTSVMSKVLAGFGLTVVTVQSLLPDVKAFVTGYVTALPPSLLELFFAVKADVAMSMVLSALTVKMAWRFFVVPKGVLPGGTP
jgi:hypothetical protein